MRRLNFDYEIEFFSEAVGDEITVGAGTMGLPFRIVNLYTGKKVGLTCFDLGTNNNPSEGLENGVGDLSWTKGEEISFTNDTVSIAGEELAKYNFNLKIDYRIPTGKQFNMAWSPSLEYSENDTVFFSQMFWVTSGTSKNSQPSVMFVDDNNDGVNDNTWKPIYPWENGDKLIYTTTVNSSNIGENILNNSNFTFGNMWPSDKYIDNDDMSFRILIYSTEYVNDPSGNYTPISYKLTGTVVSAPQPEPQRPHVPHDPHVSPLHLVQKQPPGAGSVGVEMRLEAWRRRARV